MMHLTQLPVEIIIGVALQVGVGNGGNHLQITLTIRAHATTGIWLSEDNQLPVFENWYWYNNMAGGQKNFIPVICK